VFFFSGGDDSRMEDLRAELAEVKAQLLQQHTDFNASSTQVFHMADNPMAQAREQYVADMQMLKEVCRCSCGSEFVLGQRTSNRALRRT
jgi:hypothetical protein